MGFDDHMDTPPTRAAPPPAAAPAPVQVNMAEAPAGSAIYAPSTIPVGEDKNAKAYAAIKAAQPGVWYYPHFGAGGGFIGWYQRAFQATLWRRRTFTGLFLLGVVGTILALSTYFKQCKGTETGPCSETTYNPADFVLSYDASGSVDATSWQQGLDAGVLFIQEIHKTLNAGTFQAGAVQWASGRTADIIHELSNDIPSVESTVSTAVQKSGGTDFAIGLAACGQQLKDKGQRLAKQICMFITDGQDGGSTTYDNNNDLGVYTFCQNAGITTCNKDAVLTYLKLTMSVTVYGVCVGSGCDAAGVMAVASCSGQTTSTCKYYVDAADYSALSGKAKDLASQLVNEVGGTCTSYQTSMCTGDPLVWLWMLLWLPFFLWLCCRYPEQKDPPPPGRKPSVVVPPPLKKPTYEPKLGGFNFGIDDESPRPKV